MLKYKNAKIEVVKGKEWGKEKWVGARSEVIYICYIITGIFQY